MRTWTARFIVATLVTLLAIGSHFLLASTFDLSSSPNIDWSVAAIMWLVLFGAFAAINQLPADVLDGNTHTLLMGSTQYGMGPTPEGGHRPLSIIDGQCSDIPCDTREDGGGLLPK